VIEERMGNNLRYLFTMPILARFELECHERVERDEALTADDMIELMANLYRQGYGDAVEMDHERMGITWARFSHLFSNFYVFQYATGISAAAQLAQQVREGGAAVAQRYIDFLKTGGSVYPVEALRRAGIDMRTSEPVQAAFDILSGYVERLEELVE
jgi:oligoendopeptidase F